ncbi:MAG: biotin-dependent carboxyltransferase family protein [Lachnospiraceae bacterium]|nr:biotin-dependent carboxyltransferase family protein [Lachnospiraceae bacterium]
MKMYIEKAGSLTTVQDEGRFGYMEYGVGESGAMDRYSYRLANKLVGNENGEAALEFTFIGADVVFNSDAIIAYMGAEMNAEIDGVSIKRGKPYEIYEGQKLTFGFAINGLRAYLAVAGGIDVPVVMDSRSTNLKCQMGGYMGRKIETGDALTIGGFDYSKKDALLKNKVEAPTYSDSICVRVIKGPQDDYFTDEGLNTFFNTTYKVSPESDRMGIRLSGEAIESKNGMDIVSDGITFGSIQVTSSGQPIILMADHQTTGGYAKIATVVSEDLQYLAQARPGNEVSFKCVSLQDMQKGLIHRLFGKK